MAEEIMQLHQVPLSEWLSGKGRSQGALARRTGVTQSAISKMLLSERKIFVVEKDDFVELIEHKKLGSQELLECN